MLYNIATVVTLVIGVVVLHVALFGLLLCTACLTFPPELLSRVLGHGVNFFDYLVAGVHRDYRWGARIGSRGRRRGRGGGAQGPAAATHREDEAAVEWGG